MIYSMEDKNICEKCHAKGSCCKGFQLMSLVGWEYPEELKGKVDEALKVLKHMGMEYFIPYKIYSPNPTWEHLSGKVSMTFECTRLKDGLCSDYSNRPKTCIDYRPMQDDLCRVRPFKGIPIFVN